MTIQEILTAEGIVWAGRMDCPRCKGTRKVTANESIGFAQCWSCGARWSERGIHTGNWANKLVASLAEQLQEHLAKSAPTLTWLTAKRGLPNDVGWLKAHSLGAIPPLLDTAGLIRAAEAMLEAEYEMAIEECSDTKKAKLLEVRFEEERDRLDAFKNTFAKLAAPTWRDAVAYIYKDSRGNPISINVRQHMLEKPGNHTKYCFRVQPILGRRGVFCAIPEAGTGWGKGYPTLIVEGEHNWLSLCAAADEWDADGQFAVAGFAVGGKNGADVYTAREILQKERPLVIYDNDAKPKGSDRPGGWDLVETFSSGFSLYAATTPVKDLDEWISQSEVLPNHLMQLWKQAEFVPRPASAIGAEINDIRSDEGLKSYERDSQITDLVWRDLMEKGVAYNAGDAKSPAQGILLIDQRVGRKLVEISPGHPTWSLLMHDYGIEPADPLCEKLGKNIWARTADSSSVARVSLHVLSHYSIAEKVLYLDRGNGTVLAILPSGETEILPNGENGVVFVPHLAGPGQMADVCKRGGVGLGRRGGLFDRLISGTVVWDDEAGLPVEDQKLLLRVHFFQLFFDSLISMKLCPVFEGPGGAGKNTITARIGRFLEGNTFAVQHMPHDERTLNEKSAFRLYAGFDEYDSADHQMESAFRSWCTTMRYETRRLYTNFEKAVAPLARGAGLSTNYNPIKEAATGRRQLTFFVRGRSGSTGYRSTAQDLWPEFDLESPALWAEVIADLRVIVKGLAEVAPMQTTFSMSDFAVFMLRCAEAEGWMDKAKDVLVRLEELQQRVVAQKAFWVTRVTEVLETYPEMNGKPLTSEEWCKWMRQVVPGDDRDTLSRINERKFGIYCTKSGKEIMVRALRMVEHPKHGNACRFSFSLPDACLAELRSFADETSGDGSLVM